VSAGRKSSPVARKRTTIGAAAPPPSRSRSATDAVAERDWPGVGSEVGSSSVLVWKYTAVLVPKSVTASAALAIATGNNGIGGSGLPDRRSIATRACRSGRGDRRRLADGVRPREREEASRFVRRHQDDRRSGRSRRGRGAGRGEQPAAIVAITHLRERRLAITPRPTMSPSAAPVASDCAILAPGAVSREECRPGGGGVTACGDADA